MGQYYRLANLDRSEYVQPYSLGDGMKLWEQVSAGPFGVADALLTLVALGNGRGGGDLPSERDVWKDASEYEIVIGRWAGDRIVLCGDYADLGDRPDMVPSAGAIYTLCSPHESEKDRMADVRKRIEYCWTNVERAEGGEFDDIADATAYFRRMAVELEHALNQFGTFRNIGPIVAEYFSRIADVAYVGEEGWLRRVRKEEVIGKEAPDLTL